MNRPPKKTKQHKDDLLRDPRFKQEDLERARGAKSAAAGDDRNLVSIEDAMAGADFSDKLWLFWGRNQKAILFTALIVVLVVVGYFGVHYMRAHAHSTMQAAYVQAQSEPAGLAAFADEYAGSPLGGVAYLQLADEAYAKSEFSKAAGFYANAKQGLGPTVLLGRALLGEGVSLAREGKSDEARKLLGSLVENTSVLGALRGQAAFDLIVLEISADNADAARAWLKRIGEIPGAEVWMQQAASYVTKSGFTL